MPSILSRIAELNTKFYNFAPKRSQEKIEKVLEIYKDRANLNFRTVQNMVLALYSPSLIGRDKVEKMYANFVNKYQNEEKYPTDLRGDEHQGKAGGAKGSLARGQTGLPAQRHPLHSGEEAGPYQEKGHSQTGNPTDRPEEG